MKHSANIMDVLLELSKHLNVSEFDEHITQYLERKADKRLAVREIDTVLSAIQNQILSFSLYLKHTYLLTQVKKIPQVRDDVFYTKEEIAIRYRVSVRTVTNWTYDGLELTEVGGVKRISELAMQEFVKRKKSKKFHWRSIAR